MGPEEEVEDKQQNRNLLKDWSLAGKEDGDTL